MSADYSVYQFFEDNTYECVHDYVVLKEATIVAVDCCSSDAARVGITRRVIITDASDSILFEWLYGEGITFPPALRDRSESLPNPFISGDPQ